MKIIEFLQQPSCIHAFVVLLLNTRVEGFLSDRDVVNWFYLYGIPVKMTELKQRFSEFEQMGLAKRIPPDGETRAQIKFGHGIDYVLTETGDKVAEVLLEAVNYIKTLIAKKNLHIKEL